MYRTFLYMLAMTFLTGCATPEYNSAENECSFDAFRQYPVNNVPIIVTNTRAVQVPTGEIRCSTWQIGNGSDTSCKETMKTEHIPYQETRIVDTNAGSRRSVINNCAAQLCYSRYGNAACKTKSQQQQPQQQQQSMYEGYQLTKEAAERGNADAQNNLGVRYEKGQGVTQDYREAVKWYRLAAEQGHVFSHVNLGLMYGKGWGVLQDSTRAHMWFSLASAAGETVNAAKNRDIAAKLMTPQQIEKAQEMAKACQARNFKGC